MTYTTYKGTHPTIFVSLHIFVEAGMCSLRCCQAMTGITQYRHRDWWKGFMKYFDEMHSGAFIAIPSSMKTGMPIQKLMGGR
jgi:hypothetical protein